MLLGSPATRLRPSMNEGHAGFGIERILHGGFGFRHRIDCGAVQHGVHHSYSPSSCRDRPVLRSMVQRHVTTARRWPVSRLLPGYWPTARRVGRRGRPQHGTWPGWRSGPTAFKRCMRRAMFNELGGSTPMRPIGPSSPNGARASLKRAPQWLRREAAGLFARARRLAAGATNQDSLCLVVTV